MEDEDFFKGAVISAVVIMFIIIILALFIPFPPERGKYVDDEDGSVTWIIDEHGDTLGTVN